MELAQVNRPERHRCLKPLILRFSPHAYVLLWDGVDELKYHAVTALVVRYDEVKGGIAFHFVEMGPTTMPWLSDLQRG